MHVQAQIVVNGERDPGGLLIGPPEEVLPTVAGCGVVPLQACIERRNALEKRCIEVEVFGRGQIPDIDVVDGHLIGDPVDIAELCPEYSIDLDEAEIFVAPEDFQQFGALCVSHRHILVTPCIDVEDMPELDWDLPEDLANFGN